MQTFNPGKSLLAHIEVLNGIQLAACAAAQQKHNKREAKRRILPDDSGCLQLQIMTVHGSLLPLAKHTLKALDSPDCCLKKAHH